MKNRGFLYSGIILLVGLILAFFTLPGDLQKQYLPFLPNSITQSKINLGLDLQGGSQLDYKIDLRKVPESDRDDIIDGVINVIQQRVNSLGVSEPNIYSSIVGDEHHIIVELAGIKDLDEAKETVGKTIQLEFKERRAEPDPEQAEKVRVQAENVLKKIKETDSDFEFIALEEEQLNPSKVSYTVTEEFRFKDELSGSIREVVPGMEVNEVNDELIEASGEFVFDSATGQVVQTNGYYIVKLLEKQTGTREINEPKNVVISQILISHNESPQAGEIDRSRDEARNRAQEIKAQIDALRSGTPVEEGQDAPTGSFATLAEEYSDAASSSNQGLEEVPVTENNVTYVKEVTETAFNFSEAGQISDIVESPLGFHIIKAEEINQAIDETREEEQYKVATLFFDSSDDPWVTTGLDGKFFQRADVTFDQLYNPQVSISFTPEGADMFEQLTEKNIGKPIAIFVGGEQISAPNVNSKIPDGNAVITGGFTIREAEKLARDLNTGAIPAPILLVGQYTIGASLGQEALDSSLYAGLIGLALIGLFMLFYYRAAGIIASLALFMYTTILIFLIKVALPIQLALPIAVIIFIYLVVRILNGKDSGPEKLISLILTCFVLFFMSFILSTPVVLTLAGVAGVILSIGMAVDANILIFERVKEELRDGRSLDSAINVGFERAWTSIKDSNFSSLITCAILFYFGSSIIQGFAFNLAAGILVSMFSAITLTRVFLKTFVGNKIGESKTFFGFPKKSHSKLYEIVKNRKIAYGFSTILIIFSIVGVFIFGLKPGIDFVGGSLMELKFKESVTT
ncbi:MMPL family transporter, partial [Candidatus Peregrinibacteria bacterium]|nr:MMPL family transporter [Candidatus Peregrinibacteria bacterium]